jgi:hypothetical protein
MVPISPEMQDKLMLRELILNDEDCAPLAVTNDMPKQNAIGSDAAIAEIISNKGTLKRSVGLVKRGTFLKSLGPLTGARLYTRLRDLSSTIPELSLILQEFEGDGLEISNSGEVAAFITESGLGAALTPTELLQLSSVFLEKRNISAAEVSDALRNT